MDMTKNKLRRSHHPWYYLRNHNLVVMVDHLTVLGILSFLDVRTLYYSTVITATIALGNYNGFKGLRTLLTCI